MTVKFDKTYFIKQFGVPENLVLMIMESPRLLPSERNENYFSFLTAVLNDLLPTTDLEWFVAVDLAWLLWDMQRYKRWMSAIIPLYQRAALGEVLYKTDPNYSEVEPRPAIRRKTEMHAQALKNNLSGDPALVREFEEFGYNQDALNATTFVKAAPSLAVVEKFYTSARKQFAGILRDVAVRREFAARARLLERKIAAERQKQDANRHVAARLAARDQTNQVNT